MKTITVLGEGAWGTAIATLLAHNNYKVTLWCYDHTVAQTITHTGYNAQYLPGARLSSKITPVTNIVQALHASDWVFEAVAMKYLRSLFIQCAPHITAQHKLVVLSKGIENKTLLLPSQLASELLPALKDSLVLSGPSFAYDVARQQFTHIMLSCLEKKYAREAQNILINNYFKVSFTDDLLGIQLCGAAKNVVAIALGLLDGAGYTDNTKACMLTQGFFEIAQLTQACGGAAETTYGLAGFGDLVLTATSTKSKNFSLGQQLAQTSHIGDFLASKPILPEGINTLISITELAHKHQVAIPLLTSISAIIFNNAPIASMLSVI
jgi:glycerol-3-phosphate dehydrogenase (NAD(P)+)